MAMGNKAPVNSTKKALPISQLRRDRIVGMVTPSEKKRMRAFAIAQNLSESDVIRHCIMSQVEIWEKSILK